MSPKCNMWMTTFRSNWLCCKKCKISSTSSANKTLLRLFSNLTLKLKTGSSALKPWRTLNRSTLKEPSFSTTSPIAHRNRLFTSLFLKHVSTAYLQIRSLICSLNNAVIVNLIKSLILTKESANPNPITLILPNLPTGTLMVVISLKSTKASLHVLIKKHTSMESYAPPVIFLITGVSLQIFAKNAKLDFHSIQTLETAKKLSNTNLPFYKIPNGSLRTLLKWSKIGQIFLKKTKLQATIIIVPT